MLARLTFSIPAFLLMQAVANAQVPEWPCQEIVKTVADAVPSNPACQKSWDACNYMLGAGPIFSPIHIEWNSDGSVCGGHWEGVRIEGRNDTAGILTIHVFKDNAAGASELKWSGTLRKRLTDKLILWEGFGTSPEGNGPEPIYLKRIRDIEKIWGTPFGPTLASTAPMQDDEDAQFGPGHGAYYCGDGGCEGWKIYVHVTLGKEEDFLRKLRRSNMDYTDVEKINENEYCPVDLNATISGKTTCFEVTSIPLRTPEVTLELRELAEVQSARRPGGAAGADATTFFLRTTELLADRENLDFKAVEVFDNSLRDYLPDSDQYQVSEPVFRNNSIFWNIKGRRVALERLNNASSAVSAEWWSIRMQLVVAQANFGEYFLSLGLPKTSIANWGFSSFPDDEKFSRELYDDPRFIDFRDRMIAFLTKEIPGSVVMP